MERNTICVFLPTWVGDACLATPTLRALRLAFPHCRIIGAMRPVIRDVLDMAWGADAAWLDECLLFNKRAQPGVLSRWSLIGQLRQRRVNVSVLLTNSLWSAAVARLAGAQRIVGYNRDGRGWLLSDRVPVLRDGKKPRPISPVDYYLQLAAWLGAETHNRRMQLGVSESDLQLGHELWERIGFTDGVPTIVINSGSATMATRLWPESKVRELALRLAKDCGWQVLLHCGPAERTSINALAQQADDRRIASMGVIQDLPIGLSKSALQRAAVVVSTDSGPRHISVALDRPVVTLFGPTDPVWTTTYNIAESVVTEELACRPCYKSPCPLVHHRCMQDISVERVLAAIKSSIGKPIAA